MAAAEGVFIAMEGCESRERWRSYYTYNTSHRLIIMYSLRLVCDDLFLYSGIHRNTLLPKSCQQNISPNIFFFFQLLIISTLWPSVLVFLFSFCSGESYLASVPSNHVSNFLSGCSLRSFNIDLSLNTFLCLQPAALTEIKTCRVSCLLLYSWHFYSLFSVML